MLWVVNDELSATKSPSAYIFLHCEATELGTITQSWVSAHCKSVSYLFSAFHHTFDSAGRFSRLSADGNALEPTSKPDLRVMEIK